MSNCKKKKTHKKQNLPTCSSHRASFTHRVFASRPRHGEQLSPLVVPAYVLNFFFFLLYSYVKWNPSPVRGATPRLVLFYSAILLLAAERWSAWMWLSFPHAAASLFLQKCRKLYLKKAFQFVQPTVFVLDEGVGWKSRRIKTGQDE